MGEIKFVTVPAKDLPDVFYVDGKNSYFVRYRVVSEDGTLASRWSQKFELDTGITGEDILLYTGTVPSGQPAEYSVTKSGSSPKVLTITWNVDRLFATNKIFVNRFHVYVRFHSNQTDEPWVFMGESIATSFDTIVPSGKNKADVAVLIPTYRGLDAEISSTVSPADRFPESVLLLQTDFTV